MAEKNLAVEDVQPSLSGDSDTIVKDGFGSSDHDRRDMLRMGKEQEMKIYSESSEIAGRITHAGYSTSSWQWIVLANNQGLADGGRAGLFWSYFWTFVGYGFLGASLADMAGMAPTAGGQYHWVSEFAPRKFQRILSYASGWLAVLSWQAGNASGLFLCGNMVQSMISVRDSSYGDSTWQGWLLVVACTALVTVSNLFLDRYVPMLESIFACVYVGLWLATIGVLAGLGPHVDAHTAILDFQDTGNWGNLGVALMVGQISAVFALGGSDAAAHMSEETAAAGLSVPRTVFWTVLLNGAMGFTVLIAFIFAIPSVEHALNDASGFPLIYALNLRINTSGILAFFVLNWIVLMVSNIAFQAAVSRQTMAFGRDGGLPFSSWIGRINKKREIPINAILLTATITLILCLINLGSSDAFDAILSLAAVAQMGTYSISITCVLWRRITAPQTLPKARWGLGRLGIPVNAVGAGYSWFVFFWGFWPASLPVTAGNMNYAVVMFGGVVILSLVYYFLGGKRLYAGPVTRTEEYRMQHED